MATTRSGSSLECRIGIDRQLRDAMANIRGHGRGNPGVWVPCRRGNPRGSHANGGLAEPARAGATGSVRRRRRGNTTGSLAVSCWSGSWVPLRPTTSATARSSAVSCRACRAQPRVARRGAINGAEETGLIPLEFRGGGGFGFGSQRCQCHSIILADSCPSAFTLRQQPTWIAITWCMMWSRVCRRRCASVRGRARRTR